MKISVYGMLVRVIGRVVLVWMIILLVLKLLMYLFVSVMVS